MKTSWAVLQVGLDQLLFGSFIPGEEPEDRSKAIETFLSSNGWSWDNVLDSIIMDDTICA